MVFGEVIAPRVLEVQHPDDRPFVDQRNAQLRLGLRVRHDVARVLADIRNQDGLLQLCRCSHEAAADRNVVLQMYVLFEAHGETVHQFPSAIVEQKDAEHLVIDQPGQRFGDALQQFVYVQDGCKVAADLIEQRQPAGPLRR